MSMNIQAPYPLLFAQNEQEENELQQYIQREYSREFNATIPHFLPHLLGLYRADGVLIGACGLNRGDFGTLYLEHYLDAPIEVVIATQTGHSVLRNRLVEIGNFACSESGNARIMFAAICRLLCENQLITFLVCANAQHFYFSKEDTTMILFEQLAKMAAQDPLRPALCDSYQVINYGELLPKIAALAERFRHQKIARLALLLDNGIDWAIIDLACALANIVMIPVPVFFSNEQQNWLLDSCGADALIGPARAGWISKINGLFANIRWWQNRKSPVWKNSVRLQIRPVQPTGHVLIY